jgi:hypothetical protein
MRQASPPLHSPLLPALLLVFVAVSSFGAERTPADTWAVTSAVLQRFIASLPASAIAITPANYNIHYAGSVCVGDRPAYAFRIIPRKKREGLINAVLWLDSETGIAVRESGYLAKNPSVFLKRVKMTRENELHNCTIEARITHILVETRLAGPARLVIVERPTSGKPAAGRGSAEGK